MYDADLFSYLDEHQLNIAILKQSLDGTYITPMWSFGSKVNTNHAPWDAPSTRDLTNWYKSTLRNKIILYNSSFNHAPITLQIERCIYCELQIWHASRLFQYNNNKFLA